MLKSVFFVLLLTGYSLQSPVEADTETTVSEEPRAETITEGSTATEAPEEFFPDGECPEEDGEFPVYLPDLKNCSVFYQCAHGTPYRMSCTFPLEFNPTLSVCDFPGLSGCLSDKRAPYRIIGRCPPNLSPGIKKLLRDSEDNTIYYECVNGEAVLRKCPEGTIFTFRRTCEPAA